VSFQNTSELDSVPVHMYDLLKGPSLQRFAKVLSKAEEGDFFLLNASGVN